MSLLKQGRPILRPVSTCGFMFSSGTHCLHGLLELLSLDQCTGLGVSRQPLHTAYKSRNKKSEAGLRSEQQSSSLTKTKFKKFRNYAAEGQHRTSSPPCPKSPAQILPLSEQQLVMHTCQLKSSYSLDLSFTEDRTLGTFSRTNE